MSKYEKPPWLENSTPTKAATVAGGKCENGNHPTSKTQITTPTPPRAITSYTLTADLIVAEVAYG